MIFIRGEYTTRIEMLNTPFLLSEAKIDLSKSSSGLFAANLFILDLSEFCRVEVHTLSVFIELPSGLNIFMSQI